ncbi:MAG: preprotein translocase subunit TatB [Planctomycetota bacterium]|nr:MAG: preprotein translocase subunit TatB [Planctomycetota bacterium]
MPAVYYLTSKYIGTEQKVGEILMNAFWAKLVESPSLPEKVIFLGDAVDLACEGSDALEDLAILEEKGVELLLCPICVDYYDEKDKVRVGRMTTMPEAIGIYQSDDRIVTIS